MDLNNYETEDAVFVDNKQIQCEFIAKDKTTGQRLMMVCDCTASDNWWALVQKHHTLDKIAQNTENAKTNSDEAFRNYAVQSGKAMGYLYDPDVANPNNRLILENLFVKPEGTKGDDLLFEIKLRIFDMEEVIKSSDETTKTAIRESENILESLFLCGKILGFK